MYSLIKGINELFYPIDIKNLEIFILIFKEKFTNENSCSIQI